MMNQARLPSLIFVITKYIDNIDLVLTMYDVECALCIYTTDWPTLYLCGLRVIDCAVWQFTCMS